MGNGNGFIIQKIQPKPSWFGWKAKLQKNGYNYRITINNFVVEGAGKKPGDEIFGYLMEDKNNRPIVVFYLDGRRKDIEKERVLAIAGNQTKP